LPESHYNKEYSKQLMEELEPKIQQWKDLFPKKEIE